jgi:hypothetical protein
MSGLLLVVGLKPKKNRRRLVRFGNPPAAFGARYVRNRFSPLSSPQAGCAAATVDGSPVASIEWLRASCPYVVCSLSSLHFGLLLSCDKKFYRICLQNTRRASIPTRGYAYFFLRGGEGGKYRLTKMDILSEYKSKKESGPFALMTHRTQ